jgi:nickel-type superoxide dismutase maturation protease
MPESTPERGHPEQGGGLLRRIGLAEVYNPSMLPALRPGDHLVVKYGAPVGPGDVVVVRHPLQHNLLIVKRIAERRPTGWWVVGDNPDVRNDSREFGAVPDELVIARAWMRLRPPRGLQRSVPSVLGWALGAVRPLVRVRSGGRGSSTAWRRLRAR